SSTRAKKSGGNDMEWTSPVRITFRKIPALSAYARYLPSGEIAALVTLFSNELAVSLRSMTSARRDEYRLRPHGRAKITRAERKAMHSQLCERDDFFRAETAETPIPPRAWQPSTGAMKRYPRRASVSTKIGASAESPKVSRNRRMATLRL